MSKIAVLTGFTVEGDRLRLGGDPLSSILSLRSAIGDIGGKGVHAGGHEQCGVPGRSGGNGGTRRMFDDCGDEGEYLLQLRKRACKGRGQ